MDVFDIFSVILATWYSQRVIRSSLGPFNIFQTLRNFAGIQVWDRKGELEVILDADKEGLLQDLLSCIYCISFWVGLVFFGSWFLEPLIHIPFTVAAGVVLVSKVFNWLS